VSVSSYAASDPVSAALSFALDGIALRQRTIANDIANVDTPGYRASSVDFETTLQAALASGGQDTAAQLAGASPSVVATDTPVGANGNNVDLRQETMAAMQSQFQYQLVARAVTDRFDLIKTAAGAV
jgi:flagellar basal-body rod protein FlgB